MELEWTATDPETLGLSYVEQRSGVDEYVARIEALRSYPGEGYSEVHWADRDYPLVTLQFRHPYGVVHYMSENGAIHLLVGDGVVDDEEGVLVPGLEDQSEYSGTFVMSSDRAWEVVQEFLRTGTVEQLGKWFELA